MRTSRLTATVGSSRWKSAMSEWSSRWYQRHRQQVHHSYCTYEPPPTLMTHWLVDVWSGCALKMKIQNENGLIFIVHIQPFLHLRDSREGALQSCSVTICTLLTRYADPSPDGKSDVATLVERFDIEPFSDFPAKWPNFRGLVLFCIDAKFCNNIFVDEIYKIYMLLHRSDLNIQTKFRQTFRIFRQNFAF